MDASSVAPRIGDSQSLKLAQFDTQNVKLLFQHLILTIKKRRVTPYLRAFVTNQRHKGVLWAPLVLMLFLMSCVLLIVVPEWMVDQYHPSRGQSSLTVFEYTKAVDDFRRTIVQGLGGAAGLFGLWLLLRRTKATEQTLRTSIESQITERFSKAIEQLGAVDDTGKPVLEIRFGAIYSLERIARDSARDQEAIIEILAAYIRHHRPLGNTSEPVPKDIQAIITVLGRRASSRERSYREINRLPYSLRNAIDLTRTNLAGASFVGGTFTNVDFNGSDLSGCNFSYADLCDSRFALAILKQSDFTGTRLGRPFGAQVSFLHADLTDVNFNSADLPHVLLSGATLTGAQFSWANLNGASLVDVNGFVPEMLTRAVNVDGIFGLSEEQKSAIDALREPHIAEINRFIEEQIGSDRMLGKGNLHRHWLNKLPEH